MKRSLIVLLLGIVVGGCGPRDDAVDGTPTMSPAERTTDDGGLEIQWPGGSVKIGNEGGVDVRAPGVNVNTNRDEGVRVEAPGVNVKTDRDQGVRVEAPGVDVDVRTNRGGSAGGPAGPGDDDSALLGTDGRLPVQTVSFRGPVQENNFDGTRKPLDRIPPGTRFDQQPPKDWSNIICLVEGRLASGDVEEVSETVQYYSRLFNIVILANVEKDQTDQFRLDKVGIGFSMKINGTNTVVTSDSQKELGADLSMIGRSVLDGNVESLEKVERVARNATSLLIDAPAVMLREGEHKEMIVRYLVWVSPGEGRVGTVCWLLDPESSGGNLRVVGDTLEFLPPNYVEDRVMNVKGDRFNLLGIPRKDAFALTEIPQGRDYAIGDELRQLAGLRTYDQTTYQQLLTAMSNTLATGRNG
jgi:hypothetical protein